MAKNKKAAYKRNASKRAMQKKASRKRPYHVALAQRAPLHR